MGPFLFVTVASGDNAMDVEQIIQQLELAPHPEGGYYREMYRSDETLPVSALPSRYSGDRSLQTGIYYLLTADTVSKIHRLQSDEIFHFYRGDSARILLLHPDGGSETLTLGNKIEEGERPQQIIPRDTWFGVYLPEGAEYALMGTTVAPGFAFDDFELSDAQSLTEQYPERASTIRALT